RLTLANDYLHPRHHISFYRAAGRRVRRTYIWIIAIQTSAYFGKLAIHPQMATQLGEFVERAEIGPIPGWAVLGCGLIYNLGWGFLALFTYWLDRRAHAGRTSAAAMGRTSFTLEDDDRDVVVLNSENWGRQVGTNRFAVRTDYRNLELALRNCL